MTTYNNMTLAQAIFNIEGKSYPEMVKALLHKNEYTDSRGVTYKRNPVSGEWTA